MSAEGMQDAYQMQQQSQQMVFIQMPMQQMLDGQGGPAQQAAVVAGQTVQLVQQGALQQGM